MSMALTKEHTFFRSGTSTRPEGSSTGARGITAPACPGDGGVPPRPRRRLSLSLDLELSLCHTSGLSPLVDDGWLWIPSARACPNARHRIRDHLMGRSRWNGRPTTPAERSAGRRPASGLYSLRDRPRQKGDIRQWCESHQATHQERSCQRSQWSCDIEG